MEKKKTLPEKVFIEGMPCHKFILRNLACENDARVFVKNYVAAMHHAGLEKDMIETSLLLLTSALNQQEFQYNYMEWCGPKDMPFVDQVLQDNDVTLYKSCLQYYKSIDKKAKACRICPLSRSNRNKKIEYEQKIIRYALESKKNYDMVMSSPLLPECFNSEVDVLSNTTASLTPFLYPFFRESFLLLKKPEVCLELFTAGVPYEDVFVSIHTKRLLEYKINIAKCTVSLETFCSSMISDLLPIQVCSLDEVKEAIATLLPKNMEQVSAYFSASSANTGSEIRMAQCTNLGISDLNQFYNVPKTGKKCKKKKVEIIKEEPTVITLSSILDAVNQSMDERPGVTNIEQTQGCSSIPLPDADVPDHPSCEETPVCETAQEITPDKKLGASDSQSQVLLPAVQTQGKILVDSRVDTSSSGDFDGILDYQEIDINKNYHADPDMDNFILASPTVDLEELNHFSLCLDTGSSAMLTLFESHVVKDKTLNLELVFASNHTYYLLLYSPRLHAYFHTDMGNRQVNQVLSQLLSYPSIAKYTYNPFLLMSCLVQMGMKIHNIQSLYTLGSVMMKSHRLNMDMALEELGAFKADGGVTIRPEGIITSPALLYVHCYHSVFYKNKRLLIQRGIYLSYEKANTLDLCFGISYCPSMYATDCSKKKLFLAKCAGNYQFCKTIPRVFQIDGKCLQFFFRHAPESIADVVTDLLCRMHEQDIFYSCDVLLLSMGPSYITLFIGSEDVDYVTTLINRSLLKELSIKGLRGVMYEKKELPATE